MIIEMSKVEIVGPKGLLLDVLSLVRETGAVHLETDLHGLVTPEDETRVRSLVLDEEALARRLFYDDLRSKILELFSLWPTVQTRQSYLVAEASLPLLADLVIRHLKQCRTLAGIEEQCRQRRSELQRFVLLLPPLQRLVEGVEPGPSSELVGVTVRRPEMLDPLRQALTKAVDGRFEILTAEAEDGTLVALLVTDKNHAQRLREALAGTKIAELSFPREMANLSLAQKVEALVGRLSDLDEEQEVVRSRLERFARQWKPIYRQVLDLLEERLALLTATAKIYETDMCFFLLGWMPSRQVPGLRLALEQRFSGQVDLEELALLAEDFDRVPVLLRNPRYFAPFEIFSRLLPLPGYASFDPTPFLGIFFPLLFGMILGDMGYGILLLGTSLLILWRVKKRPMVRDAARILGVCSVYTLIFGGLYGEVFGELGQRCLDFLFPLVRGGMRWRNCLTRSCP